MPRLFLGSFLSPEQQAAFAKLPQMNSSLADDWHCHVRWVNAGKLHLTWLFLGHVDEAVVAELPPAAAHLLKDFRLDQPLSLIFDRLEAWSVRRSPRHVVLTAGQPSSPFLELAAMVRKGLRHFAADDSKEQASKTLLPHITLMRLSPAGSTQATLPTSLATDDSHPLRSRQKKQVDQLDYRKIKGLSDLLPLIQNLGVISLIESYDQAGSHTYRILKNFPLA